MIKSKVKLPTLINIDAYIKGNASEVQGAIGPNDPEKIFNKLLKILNGEKADENIIVKSDDKDEWFIKLIDQPDYCVFTTMVSPKDNDYVSDDWTHDIMRYIKEMQQIIGASPKNRIANLRVVTTMGFETDEQAKIFIDEYAKFFDKRINEIGIIYNFCMLCKDDQVENPPFYMKDYIIAPITRDKLEAERIIQEVIDNLNFLAVFEGQLDRMYKAYVNIEGKFKKMENRSIAEMKKVSTILKKDLSVNQLEQYLMMINSEFSEISTLAAVLSHDSSTVSSNISNANVIYSKWNEREFSGYPKVHIASLRDLEIIANAYKSITEKLEVVRRRLQDNLEIIKTYLDLKQQNLSLKLQKSVDASSRSQIDLLIAQEEEKQMAESSKKSLANLTYIFAGLGLCEIVANFVVVYLTKDSNIILTASLLSLTLIIPLMIIGVLFWTLQKRAEAKMMSDMNAIREKKITTK